MHLRVMHLRVMHLRVMHLRVMHLRVPRRREPMPGLVAWDVEVEVGVGVGVGDSLGVGPRFHSTLDGRCLEVPHTTTVTTTNTTTTTNLAPAHDLPQALALTAIAPRPPRHNTNVGASPTAHGWCRTSRRRVAAPSPPAPQRCCRRPTSTLRGAQAWRANNTHTTTTTTTTTTKRNAKSEPCGGWPCAWTARCGSKTLESGHDTGVHPPLPSPLSRHPPPARSMLLLLVVVVVVVVCCCCESRVWPPTLAMSRRHRVAQLLAAVVPAVVAAAVGIPRVPHLPQPVVERALLRVKAQAEVHEKEREQ